MLQHRSIARKKRRTRWRIRKGTTALTLLYAIAFVSYSASGSASRNQLPPPPPPQLQQHYDIGKAALTTKPPPPPDHKLEKTSEEDQGASLSHTPLTGKRTQPPPPPQNDASHRKETDDPTSLEPENAIPQTEQDMGLPLSPDNQNSSAHSVSRGEKKLPPPPPPRQHDPPQSTQAIVGDPVGSSDRFDLTKQDSSPSALEPDQHTRRSAEMGINYQQSSDRSPNQHRPHPPTYKGTLQHIPAHEARPSFHQLRHLQQHQQLIQEQYHPSRPRRANPPQRQSTVRPPAQHARGPNGPQYAYNQSPSRQIGRASSGVLKSLWHRVERGLDGLADMEDAVADRAKGIGNAIAARTNTLVARRGQQVPPANHHPPQSIPQSSVRKYKKEEVEKPSANANEELIGNFGAKYKNIKAGSLKKQNEEKYEHLKTQPRKLDWNTIASGGRQVVGGDTSRRALTEAASSAAPSWYPQQKQQPEIPSTKPVSTVATTSQPPRQSQTSVTPNPLPVQDNGDSDDDEYFEKPSFLSKMSLPRLPRLPSPIMRLLGKGSGSFHSYSQAAMDQWEDSETSMRRNQSRRLRPLKENGRSPSVSVIPDPIADLLKRSSKRPGSLLASRDASKAKFVGQQQAIFDVGFLLFLLVGIHQLLPFFSNQDLSTPTSFSDIWSVTLPEVSAIVLAALQKAWILYAAAGAFLTMLTRLIIVDKRTGRLTDNIGTIVERLTSYSQLYKRLVASIPIDRRSPGLMRDAAEHEMLDLAAGSRLQTFVTVAVVAIFVMTVPVVRPIAEALWNGISQAVTMEGWGSWPLPYRELAGGLKSIAVNQFEKIVSLISAEMPKALENPMLVLFQVATVGALLILMLPPAVARRLTASRLQSDDDDEEDEYLSRTAESLQLTLGNLGASSATRLGVLSKKGAAGNALERWWSTVPSVTSTTGASFSPIALLRRVGYGLAAAVAAASPAVVYFLAVRPVGSSCCPSELLPPFHWDSIVDVSVLMLLALTLSWKALLSGLAVSDARQHSIDFIGRLESLTNELANNMDQSTQTQFGSSLLPTKGLSIRDLWASHAFVSAWAVRGANLDCAGGEVVLVLGDEGSGKTRLLTAIAESIIAPPRAALTTTKVRGTVSVCGVDVNKWDQGFLKRRLGLLLSDVRSLSDVAELLAGMTVEEILEPITSSAGSQSNVAAKRSAMNQAMKITGLASTLQRLPTKLGAVVSPNEDELVPSDARPPRNLLSPAEWSKLMLTRVIAQAIHDNDNASTDNTLLGSVLILDGVLSWMSEVDEARLIQKLRSTGAASILTSHKWATGRFADRIIVVKDGAIVEWGTHAELLSRGPQVSLYAAKWLAMSQS